MSKEAYFEREKWDLFWRHRKENLFGQIFDYLNEKYVFQKYASLMVQYSEKGIALEAGSGCSESTIYLGKKRGDSIVALDISKVALNGAKKFARENSLPINLICSDIRAMPLKAKSINLMFSGGVIEHFESPVDIVREMRRVSKTNIAIVPTKGFVWSYVKKIKKLIGEDKGITELPYEYYDFDYAKSIFENAGYSNIKVVKFYTLLFCPYLAIIGKD